MSRAWKNLEKQVADAFDGVRTIRLSYAQSVCDVLHGSLGIECKYGKQVPKYLGVSTPYILKTKNSDWFLVCPYHFLFIFQKDSTVTQGFRVEMRNSAQFLERGIAQAEGYAENEGKIPVLAVKPPGYRGFVIVMRFEHFDRFGEFYRKHFAERAEGQATLL